MAEPKRRGDSWFVQVREKGVSCSASFKTKREALDWRDETRRKIRAGKGVAGDRTVGDLLEEYASKVSPKKDGNQWEQVRIRKFLRHDVAKVKLADLKPKHMADWRDEQLVKLKPGSVRRELNLWSGAFSIARDEWHWIEANPLSKIDWPEDDEGRKRLVRPDELERLWHVVGHELSTRQSRAVLAFEFACHTAMRNGEILDLQPEDIDLGRSVLRVNGGKTRAARRDVPLFAEAKAILERILALNLRPVFGLTGKSRDAMWRRAVEKAGITDLHFHDSRHTAITRLSRVMELLPLARAVGISNLKTLLVYYNETAEETAARINASAAASVAAAVGSLRPAAASTAASRPAAH